MSEKRCGSYIPLNNVKIGLKGNFIIEQQGKTINNQNPNPRRCNTKSLWTLLGLLGKPTSWGHNLVILSLFGAYDMSLLRYILVLKDFLQAPAHGYGPAADLKQISFMGSISLEV